jgi:hypothetical protein
MKANALYFPYIDVPKDTWTTMSILYWDKLASILPMDYMHEPEQLGQHMQALLAEGLVEPVIPGYYLHLIPNFEKPFIELVERKLRRSTLAAFLPIGPASTVQVHAEKMGQIPDFLVNVGLAKRIDYSWYEVERGVANQFMAYLATCLGALPEVNASAVTDKAMFATFPRQNHIKGARSLDAHVDKARKVILQALLPIPDGHVDLGKLSQFKQRYGHLLPVLRARIERYCTLIASLPDPDARATLTKTFTSECKEHVDEIESAMRPSFSKITFGYLTPLFAAGLSWEGTETANPVAYAGAAMAFGATAYQAISSVRGEREALERAPLAYLARARRSFSTGRA